MKRRHAVLSVALILVSSPAWSHPGHGSGLLSGLLHPLTGIDHLLTLFAVGLWASIQSRRTREWKIPALFASVMILGCAAAFAGVGLPYLEAGVTASVLLAGLLVAFKARLNPSLAMGLIVVFALLHGYAHGLDALRVASPLRFLAGFLVTTLLLQTTGLMLGRVLLERNQAGLLRGLGWATALAGVWLAWS